MNGYAAQEVTEIACEAFGVGDGPGAVTRGQTGKLMTGEQIFGGHFVEASTPLTLEERVMGFEPTTLCLGSKYSAAELHPPNPLF